MSQTTAVEGRERESLERQLSLKVVAIGTVSRG